MTYSQASEHRVTDNLTKTVFLIGTPLVVICWRNFIHIWISSWFHIWSRCGPHFVSLFNKLRIRFKKYCNGGITCPARLSFPINDSSVSVLIFVEANAYSMSVVQAVCFSSGRNTLREWVFIYHPSHIFCSVSCPYPTSFLKESGSYHFRGSDGCSGWKSVCMTNRAALFARSIQCLSSTFMMMISLMNPSIYTSVDVISTTNGSAVERCLAD